jgi:hypothetical protein
VKDYAPRTDKFMSFLPPAVNFSEMENIASTWLLFGVGLIALNIFAQRFLFSRAPGRVFKTFLAIVTFLFSFYSTTFAIRLLYTFDSAFLNF